MKVFSAILVSMISLFPFGLANAVNPPDVIRIASPDMSAGTKPFGGANTVTLAYIRKALDAEFEKDGIKIEWSFYKGAGPAINEAFANKQLDFAYLGDLASIIGRANGVQTRYLFAVRGSNTYLGVPNDSSITSLQDLKGKRVGLYRGTADQLSFGRALAQFGLSERDIQIINLDWTAARSALAANQVDAIWQGSGVLALKERSQAKVPVSTKTTANKQATTQAGLVGTQDFISQYPDLTQRIVNILVQQAHWASDDANLGQLVALFADQGSLPPALIRGEFEGDDLRFRYNPRIDTFIRHSYADSVATAGKLRLIRKTYDTESWFAPEFVENAIVQLGLQNYWPQYDASGKTQ